MTDVEFVAPGPGQWALDRSHYPGATTPISQWLISESMAAGMQQVFAELGIPAERIDARFVHGFMYTRLRPLIGADKPPSKLPPRAVLKVATRLHPAFRKRTRLATASLVDRPFDDVVRRWHDEIRPAVAAENVRFQDTDVTALDDDELATHVSALLDHLRTQCELHFWLHGHDLGPIARYLHACLEWGLDPADALAALAGASPSTARPTEMLVEIRTLVEASDAAVESLDDIRSASPEAAALLDEYLYQRGNLLATGYDITSLRLIEMPGLVMRSVLDARPITTVDHDAVAATLRSSLPASERSTFDERLTDARSVMDMRDDNGPITAEWPLGLLRRALLEVGARLTRNGRLADPEHALEFTPDEARSPFADNNPDATAMSVRHDARTAQALLTPPATLGPDELQPPLDVLPAVLAEMVATVQVALEYLGMGASPSTDDLMGAGIGTTVHTGRARTAANADEALDRLEPGDVLVVRATSPAFNTVLTIAGAIVTADGGALSHAAVLARELGIPAVVGAPGALSIADGATVEVDASRGTVRVVSAPA